MNRVGDRPASGFKRFGRCHQRQPVAPTWSQSSHLEPSRFLIGMHRPLTFITASHSPDAVASIQGTEKALSTGGVLFYTLDGMAPCVGIGFCHPAQVGVSIARSLESALLRQSARRLDRRRAGRSREAARSSSRRRSLRSHLGPGGVDEALGKARRQHQLADSVGESQLSSPKNPFAPMR